MKNFMFLAAFTVLSATLCFKCADAKLIRKAGTEKPKYYVEEVERESKIFNDLMDQDKFVFNWNR